MYKGIRKKGKKKVKGMREKREREWLKRFGDTLKSN